MNYIFSKMALREFKIQCRQLKVLVNSMLLFVMTIIFFPLTIPADVNLLHQVFPGMVWIALLFLCLLSSEMLFQQEAEYGVIEQWLISSYPIHSMLRVKLMVIWGFQMLFVTCVSPFIAMMFNLSIHEFIVLLLSVFLGTPTLLMLNGLACAFSSGVKQKGVFMGLILLPLSLPVMVLGSGVLQHAFAHLPVQGEMALLLAMSVLSVYFLPWAMGVALRVSSCH